MDLFPTYCGIMPFKNLALYVHQQSASHHPDPGDDGDWPGSRLCYVKEASPTVGLQWHFHLSTYPRGKVVTHSQTRSYEHASGPGSA